MPGRALIPIVEPALILIVEPALIPIVGPEMMSIVGSKILRPHSNKDISVIKIKYLQ